MLGGRGRNVEVEQKGAKVVVAFAVFIISVANGSFEKRNVTASPDSSLLLNPFAPVRAAALAHALIGCVLSSSKSDGTAPRMRGLALTT